MKYDFSDEQVSLRPIRQKYDDLNNKLIEKKKRLDAINEGLKRSPVELLRVEIQQLENDKFEADEIIRIDSPEIEALTKLVDELENQKKDGNFQMNEKKKANKELADAQKELDDLKGTFSQAKELLAALRFRYWVFLLYN
jgi:chromosome segregation ATPase